MASVQYGTIVTEIKGKTQGHVFQGGNVGFVLRSKGYTAGNPSSARQVANRAMSVNAQAWRSLTSSERTTWETLATTWTFVNRFGVTYQGSGFQVFQSCNNMLLSIGEATISSAPSFVAPVDPGVLVVAPTAPLTLNLSWDNAGGSSQVANFYSPGPVSAGRNLNHLKWKKIVTRDIDSQTTVDIGLAYKAIFGALVGGQTIPIKMVTFIDTYPRAAFPQIQSGLVT